MEDQNPTVDEPIEDAKPGSKKWILIAVGLVVLLVLGGGAVYYFIGFSAEAEEVEAEQASVHQPPDQVNDVVALEPLVVNLADQGDIRYARIGVSLGLASASPGEPIIDERLIIPKLRDKCLVLVGQKTSQELGTPEVMADLKQAIASFINQELDPSQGRVNEVYFTEFIIQ